MNVPFIELGINSELFTMTLDRYRNLLVVAGGGRLLVAEYNTATG